jgi:DNA-directed RNA polymerase alpha subunit
MIRINLKIANYLNELPGIVPCFASTPSSTQTSNSLCDVKAHSSPFLAEPLGVERVRFKAFLHNAKLSASLGILFQLKKNQNKLNITANNDLFVSCRESRIENPRSFYGCFYIGPFTAEQSLTVANAIRRTLLSELKGLAITSVEIEGAMHEYSTLPGIRDSVLDILLNLKEIVLKSQFSFKTPQLGYIKVLGPGVVRAKDLKLPAFIQCVDPNQYIATLSENGILNMKMKIEEGKNYVIQKPSNFEKNINFRSKQLWMKKLADLKKQKTQNSKDKLNLQNQTSSLNTEEHNSSSLLFQKKIINKKTYPLLIDAVFMPIQKVNYIIESDQAQTNYRSHFFNQNEENSISETLQPASLNTSSINHKIILEIWTNGSLHPRQAMSYAFKELVSIFLNLEKAKILNSFTFKSLLSNQGLLNSIYFENFNYSEVLKKLNKKVSLELDSLSSKKLKNIETKNRKNIKTRLYASLPIEKNTLSPKTKNNINNELIDLGSNRTTNKIYLRDVATLNISLRPYTCLKRANIHTVGDLIQYSREELLLLRNFGKKSLQEIEQSLIELNLQLI